MLACVEVTAISLSQLSEGVLTGQLTGCVARYFQVDQGGDRSSERHAVSIFLRRCSLILTG